MKILKIQASAGKEYGHVPGHQYHDVDVTLYRNSKGWQVEIIETWGSAQSYDDELGRKSVFARAADLDETLLTAKHRAVEVGMDKSYVVQALSLAEQKACADCT
jgi:hypothetical protein